MCDGIQHCRDGSDELHCLRNKKRRRKNKHNHRHMKKHHHHIDAKSQYRTVTNQLHSTPILPLNSYKNNINNVQKSGIYTTMATNESYNNLDTVQKVYGNSEIFISHKNHHKYIDDKSSDTTREYNNKFSNNYESDLYIGDEKMDLLGPKHPTENGHLKTKLNAY